MTIEEAGSTAALVAPVNFFEAGDRPTGRRSHALERATFCAQQPGYRSTRPHGALPSEHVFCG